MLSVSLGTSACGLELDAPEREPAESPAIGEHRERPAPTPRLRRLTHRQWENTVRDLFNLPDKTGYARLLRADAGASGHLFDNASAALELDEALWLGYRVAAAGVAARVTEEPALLAELLPPSSEVDDARAREFVERFATRAYRRPLDALERAELLELFAAAPGLYPELDDPLVAGVRHVVEAVLQSPLFLYRVERSVAAAGPGDDVITLDGWELAQRLSYFLWDTMPDEELFAAAESGALARSAGLEAQARRMLEDPRAAAVVSAFHRQLLDADRYLDIAPAAARFPDAPTRLGERALEEHERFIRDIVYGQDGGLYELLRSRESFVDAELAAIYGLATPRDKALQTGELVHVELDAKRRAGILTRIGFLASRSSSVEPDPILRGAAIARRLACLEFGARPDDAPTLPGFAPEQTGRERVEAHTEQPGSECTECHAAVINPFGFALEHFDALGAWREQDNGLPIDARATVSLGSAELPVDGALELAARMSESAAVHRCYARRWLEFATGQPARAEDQALIERLGEASLARRQSIKQLLLALVRSTAFRSRAVEELP